jgi:hypothetical protein
MPINKLIIKYNKNNKPIYYNKVGMQTNKETYEKQLAQEKKVQEREREKNKKLQLKNLENEKERYKKDLAAYEKENVRSAAEMAKKAFERKEAKKLIEAPKKDINLEALRSFRNAIDGESDSLSEKYNEIFDKYTNLIKAKETKVLAGKYLRLSNKYDRLNKNFNDLFESADKAKLVTTSNESTFEDYVKRVDIFEKEYEALNIEEISLQKAIEQKKKEKLKKDQERQKKKESKDKRITKKRNESDIKKAALEKEKADEVRKKETRQRRIQAVEVGRAKQAEQEENQRQELFENISKKKEQLQGKRDKVDKFFDLSNSSILHAGVKAGGILGSTIGTPLKTFGFDFSDESQFLSTLFSPVKALGNYGLGKAKSFTEKRMGIDDDSMNSFDDVYQDGAKGKKKQLNVQKAQNILNNSKNVSAKKPSGISGINKKLKNVGSLLSSKNISNIFNKNNSQSYNSQSNNSQNSMANSNSSVNDFNRTDDKDGEVNLGSTNGILIQILKELKKQTSEEKKSNGLFGGNSKGSKALSLIKSFGLPGAVGFGAAYLWNKFTKNEDNSQIDNSISKQSKKIISTSSNSFHDEAKQNHEEFKKNHPSLAKVQNFLGGTVFDKDSTSSIISNKTINNDSLNQSKNSSIRSVDSTFNASTSTKNIIKAEAKKIEKIRDDQESNKDIADDMKKFFLDDFLNSAIEKFSAILINSKSGSGKSFMPSIKPF